MSSDFIETEGVVIKVLPNTVFRVQLENGKEILGNLSNDMRENYIRILVGDRVKVELVSSDSTQGRITRLIP